MADLSLQINGLSDGDLDLGAGGFRRNTMESKPFPPSGGILAVFETVESWDGKGKGSLAAGRMFLKALRFLVSRWMPSAGAPGRTLNDINASSAIRSPHGRRTLSL